MTEYDLVQAESLESNLYYRGFTDSKSENSVSRFKGRVAGILTSVIPGGAIEPVQMHLIARDGKPFEETIWASRPLLIRYHNIAANERFDVVYPAGQRVSIPLYIPHWLANPNREDLTLNCLYAPFSWGEDDEPEFFSFDALKKFANDHDLVGKMIESAKNFL